MFLYFKNLKNLINIQTNVIIGLKFLCELLATLLIEIIDSINDLINYMEYYKAVILLSVNSN